MSGFKKSFNEIEAESLKHGLRARDLEASINQKALINEIAFGAPKFSQEAILGTKTVKDFKRNFHDFDFRSPEPTSISQEATFSRTNNENLGN